MTSSSFAVLAALLVVLAPRVEGLHAEADCLNNLIRWCQGTMRLDAQCSTGYADPHHKCDVGGQTIGCQRDGMPWIRCEKGYFSQNRLQYKGRQATSPLAADEDICESAHHFLRSLLPGLSAQIHNGFITGVKGVEAGQKALESSHALFQRLAKVFKGWINPGSWPSGDLGLDVQKESLVKICRDCMQQLNAGMDGGKCIEPTMTVSQSAGHG